MLDYIFEQSIHIKKVRSFKIKLQTFKLFYLFNTTIYTSEDLPKTVQLGVASDAPSPDFNTYPDAQNCFSFG
jgi:hypothetical protein